MAAWVALAGTSDLPIAEGPAKAALADGAEARGVPLPYKKLTADEEGPWAGALVGAGRPRPPRRSVPPTPLHRRPDP